tara:strand:+ start:6989 stop:7918 length:930 start_codon:yes stop_codon:yes gene_type:complete
MSDDIEQTTEQETEPEQLAIVIEDTEEPAKEAEVEQEAPVEAKESDESADLEDYSDNVKRRIGKMTAKLRESERREKAATEYAQAVNAELEQMKQKAANLDKSFVNEFDNRVQSEEALLTQELKRAIDVGDATKQAEIQVRLSQVAADKDRVARVRKQQEQQAGQPAPQPQQQPYTAPQQQVRQNPTYDPKAQKWAEEREWFGTDRAMTLLTLAEHESMMTEGYDPDNDSETYYKELEKRIVEAFPHKFQKDKKRKSPKVASAGRVRTNANGKKEIVLTESEATMADRLNVPRTEYAKRLQEIRERNAQ